MLSEDMIENHSVSREERVPKRETVYGDGSTNYDGGSVDSGESSPLHGGQAVISEKVRSLANNVYREFESLIDIYGRDVVQNLMPLVVACLENLDRLYAEKSEIEVEMDLLKEDNNQLINQFEKERQMRKATEEKILQAEDRHEDYKNEMINKLEGLETSVKMMEMKSKSAQDHVSRLEEKEAEMKAENSRLHERYNDLLRNYMEVVERGKGGASITDIDTESLGSTPADRVHVHHHHHHVRRSHHRREHHGHDQEKHLEDSNSLKTGEHEETGYSDADDDLGRSLEQELTMPGMSSDGEQTGSWEQPREDLGAFEPDSAMFEEMTMPDEGDVQSDEGPDCLDDQDYESEFGMSREIDNLIKENMELVETKNALNIVKDDLITQLDDLTRENEVLHNEVDVLTDVKSRFKTHIRALETELKSAKHELDKAKEKIKEMGDEDEAEESDSVLNPAFRRRFTRGEMVRLLTERNQYKERLMELQEAVRWTEMMRARRDHPELVTDTGAGSTSGRRGMWKYFSGLFGNSGDANPQSSSTPSALPAAPTTNVINANVPPSSSSTSLSKISNSSTSGDAPKPRRSNSGSSLSAATNALSALASFLSPSPSGGTTGNPLFMTPPPSAQPFALTGSSSSPAESPAADTSQVGLGAAAVPRLVAHDVRLLPASRGPGSAVKRVDDSKDEQKK